MANLKFWNIGKANDEIARLESANAALSAQIADMTGNTPLAVADLEARLKASEESKQALTGEIEARKQAMATKDATIADLTAKLEVKSSEVETLASRKALEIQASLGQSTTPPAPSTTKPALKQSGIDRIAAAFKAQSEHN